MLRIEGSSLCVLELLIRLTNPVTIQSAPHPTTSYHTLQIQSCGLRRIMAIFEQVQVRVVGAGTPLYEYDDPANDYDQTLVKQDNVVIEKHVESTPGSNFEIEIMIKPGFKYSKYVNCDALRASAYVDGTLMGRPLLLEKDYVQEPKGLRLLIEGKKVLVEGVWQLLKFRFQALQTGMCK